MRTASVTRTGRCSFEEHKHALKGVSEPWRLYAVAD
jgi:hypothetical protein